ncbi:hypothetical protein NQ315_003637 [Exocentrus adspersus]|uniref:Uncharacterized protein n=1 Tax=Exocentrus adspersus TaxID=1586481 RepID=A0AAV8VCK2_9CUCU|nr:hypothetical protein NQ315_003637 [Exocentrus adspersus]
MDKSLCIVYYKKNCHYRSRVIIARLPVIYGCPPGTLDFDSIRWSAQSLLDLTLQANIKFTCIAYSFEVFHGAEILLLHHVIPGAFTIGSLQDEMTGVSLAGTQLRVNQYNMHDVEWNDIKVGVDYSIVIVICTRSVDMMSNTECSNVRVLLCKIYVGHCDKIVIVKVTILYNIRILENICSD